MKKQYFVREADCNRGGGYIQRSMSVLLWAKKETPPRYLSLQIEERFVEKKLRRKKLKIMTTDAALTCFSARLGFKGSKMWRTSEIEEVFQQLKRIKMLEILRMKIC